MDGGLSPPFLYYAVHIEWNVWSINIDLFLTCYIFCLCLCCFIASLPIHGAPERVLNYTIIFIFKKFLVLSYYSHNPHNYLLLVLLWEGEWEGSFKYEADLMWKYSTTLDQTSRVREKI